MSFGLSVARVCLGLSLCLGMYLAPQNSVHADIVVDVDFEEFDLGVDGYVNKTPGADPMGIEQEGLFNSHGVGFSNTYSNYGSDYWTGFAISNHTDITTKGDKNQYSAFPGSGASGTLKYGIGFVDVYVQSTAYFAGLNAVDQLKILPSIYLPGNMRVESMMVSNTTYAALAMKDGDNFAAPFQEGDFLKLSVYGIDAYDKVLSSSVDFMLADYQSGRTNILGEWEMLNLSPLEGAQSLHFNLTSNYAPQAMLHPTYFAMDNLKLSAVPEPSGLFLLTCMGLGLAFRRSRASE